MRTSNTFSPIDPLPSTVTVNGREYEIRSDFKTALAFMEYVDGHADEDDDTFVETVLRLWYPTVPEDESAALIEILRFYCGGTLPGEGYYYKPVFAPADYPERIHSEILTRYGIDPDRETIHWWVFRDLMAHLPCGRCL